MDHPKTIFHVTPYRPFQGSGLATALFPLHPVGGDLFVRKEAR
jgi:hypothetical protein